MPRISDAQRAARRAQILDAAWRCFDRDGLHATTVEDIIQASELSAGAVYSYFPSKEALIEAAVITSLGGLRGLLDPMIDRTPPPDPATFVREALALIARHVQRDGFNLGRIALYGWGETQRNDQLRRVVAGVYTAFRARLAELAERWRAADMITPTADPQAVAATLLSLLFGTVVQGALLGDASADVYSAGIAAFRHELPPPPPAAPAAHPSPQSP